MTGDVVPLIDEQLGTCGPNQAVSTPFTMPAVFCRWDFQVHRHPRPPAATNRNPHIYQELAKAIKDWEKKATGWHKELHWTDCIAYAE